MRQQTKREVEHRDLIVDTIVETLAHYYVEPSDFAHRDIAKEIADDLVDIGAIVEPEGRQP